MLCYATPAIDFAAASDKEISNKSPIFIIIHSATGASAVAGLIPIPMSDAIPITAAQIGMIIKIGDLFFFKSYILK